MKEETKSITENKQNVFNVRMEEEITAFAKRHNLDYEFVAFFAQWIEWYSRQEERKRIIDLIKSSLLTNSD